MFVVSGVIYNSASVSYVNSRTYSNTVIVKSPEDLLNIDSTKNYMIDGAIDMGSTGYSDLQWFTQSTNNAFVYDGDQTMLVNGYVILSERAS